MGMHAVLQQCGGVGWESPASEVTSLIVCCCWLWQLLPAERAEQEDADAAALCGSEDDGFLRFLASYYLDRRKHQLAMQCLQRLTVLAPGGATQLCWVECCK